MKVLLAGETFLATTTVASGGDTITSASWSNGAVAFNAALAAAGITVTQIGGEHCGADFPRTLSELAAYDAVIVSDVSALTLLMTPDARGGKVGPNRLELLKTYVEGGGGLMLAGGYMGFQGMFGTARFADTAVEDVLPVRCLPYSDGLEVPEGLAAALLAPTHPILAGIDEPLPPILGLNKLEFRGDDGSTLLAVCPYRGKDWPLLAIRDYGKGRSVIWSTDIGPHWLSHDFLDWRLYGTLMANIVTWLCQKDRQN
ncbi:MAG: glutamine amidotransferase [Pseudomonadota bacterium]